MDKNDENTTVIELANAVYRFVEERDWRQFHTPKNLAAAIAIEASELQELFLWRDDGDAISGGKFVGKRWKQLNEELADIIIFCLALSNEAGVDITKAVFEKLRKNTEKYPADEWKGRAW